MESLLSAQFILTAVGAIFLLAVLSGRGRQLAFLALNLTFLWSVLHNRVHAVGTVLYVLLGYAFVHLGIRRGRAGLIAGLVIYVTLFIHFRGYDFLDWFYPNAPLTGLLRSIGLSFVLFKVLHVMIDGAGGTLGRIDLPTYLNYIFNFTTFMMGPIQRFQDYRDQWTGAREAIPPTFEAHLDAVNRALIGIVKAYLLAPIFAAGALKPDTDLLSLSFTGLLVRTYAFWFFLYLNFSGYCDVAIGIGRLIGIRPPENFDKPFLARNVSDFWLRQHRSLTLWLTDYVFSPLYAKLLSIRWTAPRKHLAANLSLVATMLVSGLWHGTTISFLLFGLVHGLWFVIYRTWDAFLLGRLGRDGVRRFRAHTLVRAGGIFLTFNATALAFVFFQSSPERVTEALSSWFSV